MADIPWHIKAGMSIFVLAEKVVPAGRLISRVCGLAFVDAGAWFLIAPR
jgi:predicted metal-binding membrane protein